MFRSPLRTSARCSATLFAATTFITSGCADRATAPDATVPQGMNTRASADVATDADIEAAGIGGRPGTITIRVDLQPDGSLDVPFTTAGKKIRDFTLDDDADPALSNVRTFEKLRPGTYTVQTPTELGQYGLTSISCSNDGTSTFSPNVPLGTITIGLAPGNHVSCTFVLSVVVIPTP